MLITDSFVVESSNRHEALDLLLLLLRIFVPGAHAKAAKAKAFLASRYFCPLSTVIAEL